jgi:N-formylglutamate amidohydrolase
MRYYRKQRNLAAVMIEANRALYVDETTGERKPCFASVARTIREVVISGVSLLNLRDEGGFHD